MKKTERMDKMTLVGEQCRVSLFVRMSFQEH